MNQYETQLADYAKSVNDALRAQLSYKNSCLQMIVIDAMRYSLLDAGKRLRATLVLEFARLCNTGRQSAMPFAAAVEMVHAYSLVHDDLPCMDDDDLRRGKPSCHKQFGEANALLAGDALLTMAFEMITGADIPDAGKVQAVRTLSQAAGVFGMIGGQVIDLACEGKASDMLTINTLYSLKTGALITASAQMGCIAGNAGEALMQAAEEYARAFGLAFQITDDILDIVADEAVLGKPIGSDQENGKTTYVTLLGLDKAKIAARQQVERAKDSIASIDKNGFLTWLVDMVLERKY